MPSSRERNAGDCVVVGAVHPHGHAHAGDLVGWLVRVSGPPVRRGVELARRQIPGPELEVRRDDVHAPTAHRLRPSRWLRRRARLRRARRRDRRSRHSCRSARIIVAAAASAAASSAFWLCVRLDQTAPDVDRERREQEQRGHCERGDHHHRAPFPPLDPSFACASCAAPAATGWHRYGSPPPARASRSARSALRAGSVELSRRIMSP